MDNNIKFETLPNLKAVVITGKVNIKKANNADTVTSAGDINIYVDFKMDNQIAGLYTSVEKAREYVDTELKALGVTGFVVPVNQQ